MRWLFSLFGCFWCFWKCAMQPACWVSIWCWIIDWVITTSCGNFENFSYPRKVSWGALLMCPLISGNEKLRLSRVWCVSSKFFPSLSTEKNYSGNPFLFQRFWISSINKLFQKDFQSIFSSDRTEIFVQSILLIHDCASQGLLLHVWDIYAGKGMGKEVEISLWFWKEKFQ